MTKDDIIPSRTDVLSMAREAGFSSAVGKYIALAAELERFAALIASRVAAAERKRVRSAMKKAHLRMSAYLVAAEREACHALRQTLPNPHKHCQVSAHAYDMAIATYGAAIRARGQQ